jgi:hypothetical protein
VSGQQSERIFRAVHVVVVVVVMMMMMTDDDDDDELQYLLKMG